MESFAQILQWLRKGDALASNNYSGNATPFKVQVNLEIPIFEDQIDVDVVDKWLNLLEGYFSVHDFPAGKISLLHFLKHPPMSRTTGKPTLSRRMKV